MGNQQGKLQNQNHSGRPKKVVTWKSAERPSPPGRPILIPLSEQQADVVSLRWERPKLDGGSPITGYVVEHRRMGSPHWVRATPTAITQCEVSISGLEPGWRYQFRVFAENIVGRSDPSDLSDALTVTLQRTAICVPNFIEELQDRQAVEDERIEFRVHFVGQPPPEINWFKDGYEIFSSRRTKILNDNDVSVLIIHQVALTDEGEIKCTATNRAGHVATKCQLMVQAPPKIRLPRTYEDGLIVEAGEVLRLKVGVAGQPPPAVTWLHEGEVVGNGGRFEISNTDRNSLLKIDSIQRDDRGEYSVRAWNQLGEDVTSFLVTVTARPNPPGKVQLNMSFGKSATLSWTSPLDDGGCKIGYYIVEYFRVGWNVWLKAATTRSLCTTLHDLIEGSEYKFRVKAENPYGVSDPSEESEVLFIPDPKRGITKPKSETKLTEEKTKNVPPRRKALSPPRPHADAATEISPGALRKPRPQLVDTEELHREMSYGTPDKVLKLDVRRSPSIPNAAKTPSPGMPKKNLLPTPTKPSSKPAPISPAPISPIPKSPQRSPLAENKTVPQFLQQLLPAKDKSPSPSKQKITPTLATPEPELTPENPSTPELTRTHLLFRKRSLSPPTEEINSTPALQRSAEPVHLGVNQNVRRNSGHSLSPAKNAPSLAVAIATGAMGKVGVPEEKKSPQIKKREKAKEKIKHEDEEAEFERWKRTDRMHRQEQLLDAEKGARTERIDQHKRQSERLEHMKKEQTKPNERTDQVDRDKQAEWTEWVAKANGNNVALQNRNHHHNKNNNSNNNNHKKQTTTSAANPTIEISAPPPTKSPISKPPPPVNPLSHADKQEDVHTSNEFMLVVFDKNSKVKDKNKQDSFELDLEDAIQPPPISISSPDLASLEFTNLHTFPLRRSVSSTELLYERAMARFYEAVELEEAEKSRKLRNSQDASRDKQNKEKDLEKPLTSGSLQPTFVRKRLASMSEAERLSFERRSELRRQSESFVHDLKTAAARWGSRENLSTSKTLSRTSGVRLNKEDSREVYNDEEEDFDIEDYDKLMEEGEAASGYQPRTEPKKQSSFDIESDYTESTEDDEDDSIERFKMELRARTKTPSPIRASPPRDHMETYHPRNMSAGVFTPYRAPMPDNAAVVLTRPAPLTDPDFVPKPILKRSSNENVQPLIEASNSGNGNNKTFEPYERRRSLEDIEKREYIENIEPIEHIEPAIGDNNNTASRNEKSGFADSFMSFFKRDSRSNNEKSNEENVNVTGIMSKPPPLSPTIVAAELEAKRKAKEEEDAKRQEAERLMHEEAFAVVDHYSDIVNRISSTRNYHTPIYLDKEQQKKAGANTDYEEEMRMRRSQSPDDGLMPPINTKPRLSISEREQLMHVRESGSGMAYTEQPKISALNTPTPSEDSSQALSMPLVKESVTPKSNVINRKPNVNTSKSTPITAHPPPLPPDFLENDDDTTTSEIISETTYERPDSRGRTRIVKVKRIIKKRVPSRSRDASSNRPPSGAASQQDIDSDIPSEAQSAVRRRVLSRTRSSTGQSKSPGPFGRRPLPAAAASSVDTGGIRTPPPEAILAALANEKTATKSVEQLEEEAHEKVRSALSYSTDLVLFMVACYVYLFKDAWLVLPILSLMIYRQLGDFINDCIPKWMKRKKN